MPETVRESKIPTNKPLNKVPITFPLALGPANTAPQGIMIWGTIDNKPIKKEAHANNVNDGAKKAANNEIAESAAIRIISFGRSTTSPNGTKNNKPNA